MKIFAVHCLACNAIVGMAPGVLFAEEQEGKLNHEATSHELACHPPSPSQDPRQQTLFPEKRGIRVDTYVLYSEGEEE